MSKLYIFDLEGTTGIYNDGMQPHIHNVMLLRPGFKEVINRIREKGNYAAVATRAPRKYTDSIIDNLKEQGVYWQGPILSKEEVQFEDDNLFSYKNLSSIYECFKISDPSKEAVILGDFLRFPPGICSAVQGYSLDEYLSFDFEEKPEVLFDNYALNDHPFPHRGITPVYVVVPQPWTTPDSQGMLVSLDMEYVVDFLEAMFIMGDMNFGQGFDVIREQEELNQCVQSSGLAQRTLQLDHQQKYLVMKGQQSDWKPLIRKGF